MKAIVLPAFGPADQLTLTNLEVPEPAAGEVLVQVKAISINPVDVKTRAGKGIAGRLKEIQPLILGWDISGMVVGLGAGVTNFKVGDEVFGMINFPGHGRAYAEYVSAPAAHLTHKPANITHAEAAAATLAALTAWQVLQAARLQPGQHVLIHAAAGGVGHYAVQLAARQGAIITATASGPKAIIAMQLGAHGVIDYTHQPFEKVMKEVDFVLDTLGGDILLRSLEVVKRGGKLITIPTGLSEAARTAAEQRGVDAAFMLVQSNGADMKALADLLAEGKLRSLIDKTFPFDNMAGAHLAVETGRTTGKVVVTL